MHLETVKSHLLHNVIKGSFRPSGSMQAKLFRVCCVHLDEYSEIVSCRVFAATA